MIRALIIAIVMFSFSSGLALAQTANPKRVGYFSASSAAVNAPRLVAFRQGMTDLGWTYDKDYIVDARYAEGQGSDIARLARDVVAARPDLILTPGDEAIRALAGATKTIPIVFATSVDPIGLGAARSLQRPGGNATGLVTLRAPLGAKRVELLKQAFPHVQRIGVLYAGNDVASKPQLKEVEAAAARLDIRVVRGDLDNSAGIAVAIKEAAAGGCDAFVLIDSYIMNTKRQEVIDAVNAARRPAIFARPEQVEAGGLMSYASSSLQNFRRAAVYVDKILKGANPGDLPIEQPSTFELTINMKTAKAAGVTVPTSLLVRADKIIQ